ncbi:MAG: DegV family protein, partial [Anaerolineaceae bacterium]|nr:DegV family protein [Anaerolineaceae bacterium]
LTDSTAYLGKEYVEKHNISVIPLNIHWDGDTYKDNVDITPDEFYTRLSTSSTIPSTSQPSVGEFEEVYKNLAKDCSGVSAALISSGISGTVDSATLAKKSVKGLKVDVIDSRTTSGGLALMVKAITAAVESGKSLEEVRALAREVVKSMGTYFVVDTLKYLHKGGRIGGASRFFGTALKIKPVLYLNEEGKIDALEKVRTKKKAHQYLADLVIKKAGGKKCYIAVMHAQAKKDAEVVAGQLQQQLDCAEIGIYDLSPVIGTHVGEGTIGVSVHTVQY